MKEIASKVPTTSDELAECMVPEHFQKEYGERLLKNINAYIESENLREIIEKQPRKKQKRKEKESRHCSAGPKPWAGGSSKPLGYRR